MCPLNYSYTGTLYIRRYDTRDYSLNKFKRKDEKIQISEKPKDQWIGIEIPAIINRDTWKKAIFLLDKSKRIHKSFRADTMLVGDVPESYINVPEGNGNNDYLNFVPTNDPFDNK